MSPNPAVISQSSELEIDRNDWKILFLGVLAVAASASAFYFFNKLLLTGDALTFLISAVLVGLFLALATLLGFFTKRLWKLNLIMVFSALGPLLVFHDRVYPNPEPTLIVGAILMAIFLMWGASRGSGLLENSIRIRFDATFKSMLPKIATGVIIFSTVIFYLNYFVWGHFNEKFAQIFIDQTISAGDPVLHLWFPSASFSENVNDFLKSVSTDQLKKSSQKVTDSQNLTGSSPTFNQLTPDEQAKAIQAEANALYSELQSVIGKVPGDEPVHNMLYSFIKNYTVNKLPSGAQSILGYVSAVTFFFLMKSLAFLLYWLVELCAFVLYQLLLVIGFAYVNLETRSREFIMLK